MKCDIGCQIERIEQMIRQSVWTGGSRGIVIGVSGGVDSAVAAALCAGAVGPERVRAFTLPSAVTADTDIRDAEALCRELGIPRQTISIAPVLESFRQMPGFEPSPYLEGNLMARIRMTILYYQANRAGCLVCGTSNKSEYLVGYCTKYGDNAADIQPILHLYKTEVYELARELRIPEAIIGKAPSAGLWPGQTDEKELGLSYAEIDAALIALEENRWKPRDPREETVLARVKASVHKRQAAPSLLVTG
jgi:NAD+ synthase